MRILLVEDNRDLAHGMARTLTDAGHAVDATADGIEADDILAIQEYDLVILDLTLPGMDGLEVLANLRRRKVTTPVLVLTARAGVEDRVAGLDTGADDYMTKPFDLAELAAGVRALARRSYAAKGPEIAHGPLSFDSAGRTVTLNGRRLDMPRREMGLLEILLLNAGRVVSKEQIAARLFSFEQEASLSAVELYVHRLRRKLEPAGISIRTIRGLGYLLEEP